MLTLLFERARYCQAEQATCNMSINPSSVSASRTFLPRIMTRVLASAFMLNAIAATSTPLLQADAQQASNATYTPELQTTKQADFWIEELADGFNFPSSMAWLPDGTMLVTCQDGSLYKVSHSTYALDTITGVPESYPGVWNGLRDVVVDPEFQNTNLIYLYITEGDLESRRPAVYRAELSGTTLQNVDRIFISNRGHGGSGVGIIATRMIILNDGTLLLGIADERTDSAQDLSSHLGKTLRINRDGSVPADNPFVQNSKAEPEIWTLGHRVALGLYQDRTSDDVLETEAGPRGGDELNRLIPGANYGWAETSWGFAYGNNGLDAPAQTKPGITDPVQVWTPSVTPAGITRLNSQVYPAWSGDYFIGLLTAKQLERVRMRNGEVVLQERLLTSFGERIRDVKTGPDGYIYLLTDNENGRLLRLQPGKPTASESARVAQNLEGAWRTDSIWRDADGNKIDVTPGDPMRGKRAFIQRCSACHSVGEEIKGGAIGPDLDKIFGRLFGRRENFSYSANMSGSPKTWDATYLNKYIANPSALIAGTTMASPPISDAQLRRDIVGYLKHQSEAGTQP